MWLLFVICLCARGALLQMGPCGTCPCNSAPCVNNSDCCSTAQNWTVGNASICVGGLQGCIYCSDYGGICLSDAQCRCINANSSCDQDTSLCIFDTPDAPCGFCPCGGQACTNNSECCDPTQFSVGNASYCSGGFCAQCIGPGDFCGVDADCQCNNTPYVCIAYTCQPPTPAPTASPTGAPIGCTNATQCPDNFVCSPYTMGCIECEEESGCCNSAGGCAGLPNTYCSPIYQLCLPCSGLNQSCVIDPANVCGCNATDNLTCLSGSHVCGVAPPTPSPTTSSSVTATWVPLVVVAALTFVAILIVLCAWCCCWCWPLAKCKHHRRRRHVDDTPFYV